MTWRVFLTACLSLVAALTLTSNPASAAGETWWWDGETVIGKDGELGAGGARFNLTSADDSEYEGTITSARTVPGTYTENDTSRQCTEYGNCNGETHNTTCRIKNPITISVNRGSNPATVSVGNIQYERADGSGGQCKPNSPLTISGGAMQNAYGSNATNDQAMAYLESQRGDLLDKYLQDRCGNLEGAEKAECERNARDSFNARFESCKREVTTNTSQGEVLTEKIQQCLKSKGIGEISPDELNGAIYSIPNYETQDPSCSLEWLGYVVCPISRFLATITDKAFDALQVLFVIRPLAPESQAGEALYASWSVFRNIANVAFIIAILAIVLSYVTSMGIDNYGIKRMLPRIVVAAILVNVSYFICILAVDIANILGDSLQKVLIAIAPSGSDPNFAQDAWVTIVENVLVVGAGGAAVAGAAIYASFAALVPMLTSVALSLLLTVFLLTARYAIILILIIIAPLAFVAYLLPNTQKWFSKWLSSFTMLLALYPIIAVIYGGSTLAGLIVIGSAVETQSLTLVAFGLAIQALPLAITPLIMKLGGGILNRFGGVVSSQGLFKNTKQRADDFAKNAKNRRDIKGLRNTGDNARGGLAGARDKAIQRRYRRSAISGIRQNELNMANRGYVSDYATGQAGSGGDKTSWKDAASSKLNPWHEKDEDGNRVAPKTRGEKYLESMAAGNTQAELDRARANQQGEQLKLHAEEVKANKLVLESRSMDEVAAFARGEGSGGDDPALREAAMSIVVNHGDPRLIDEVTKSIASQGTNLSQQQRSAYVNMVRTSGVLQRQGYYKNPAVLENLERGSYGAGFDFSRDIVAPSVGELSAKDFSAMNEHTSAQVQGAIAAGHVDDTSRQSAAANAREALDNRYTSQNLSSQTQANLQSFAAPR